MSFCSTPTTQLQLADESCITQQDTECRDLQQQQSQVIEISQGLDIMESSYSFIEDSLIRKVDLNHKEIEYFALNLQKEKQEIENKFKCTIEIELENDKPDVLQINYQNKCFKIIQGNIQKLQSEAIVNTSNQSLEFGNPSMQTGVAKKIQQLGGIRYEDACKKYIKENSQLKFASVFPHHHKAVLIKYILTVATPFYEKGQKTETHLEIIKQNIEAIFQMADKFKIKEITFPIIGGGTAGFQFDSAAQTVISSVIDTLYSNTKVQAAYIIEIDPQKILKLIDITKKILNHTPKRQVKYQWKWFDKGTFLPYDDEEVNEQIDIKYQEFLLDNSKTEMQLTFPISKSPGTHIVDLVNKTLTDISLNQFTPISLLSHQGRKKYFFGKEPVSDQLNEFIFIHNSQGIKQFQIFYKTYKIIFRDCHDALKIQEVANEFQLIRQHKIILKQKIQTYSKTQLISFRNGRILQQDLKEDEFFLNQELDKQSYQINEVTKYQRPIIKTPYEKQQKQDRRCILIGKQYELQQFCLDEQEKKSTISVIMMDITKKHKIEKKIRKSIHKNFVEVILPIPKLMSADLHTLSQIINDNSLKPVGQVTVCDSVSIIITHQIKQDIMNHIQQGQTKAEEYNWLLGSQIALTYPKEWAPQQLNVLKVALSSPDLEYQKIENLFKATEKNRRIHLISRIQNIILWQNYVRERRKLLQLYKDRNQELNNEEIEIYAWHGTRAQHPNIIYDSDREGFNPEFSQDKCLWGPACYFAEKASYSGAYSYTLKPEDDATNQGKKVFLCCLLTTGRAIPCAENNTLRKPPGDYDCVTGVTKESTVYMLYQMGARRAYPAYEVIYE